MKTFLLIPNDKKDTDLAVTQAVLAVLTAGGGRVYMHEPYSHLCDGEAVAVCESGTAPKEAEAVISIGGDGTVLEASRYAMRLGVPLLGVNLGRRGYLADLDADRLGELNRLFTDSLSARELMTLSVTLIRGGREWPMPRLSVNDVVFYRASTGHAIDLSVQEGEGTALRYLADGLVFATPTGSTAYSLSAGGPILPATMDCVCTTPLCPHSFFNRSVVFDGASPIYVQNNGTDDEKILVTLDGRENFFLQPGDRVKIERAAARLRLLSPDERDYIGILRKKMKVTE